MRDPYVVLGVKRDASADDLKAAYRKLAKQYHPDLNPGNAPIEAKFKEISAAYDLLSDPEKRVRFDRGELDAHGNERPQARRPASGGGFGGFGGGAGARRGGGFGGIDPEDLFDLFGGHGRNRGGQAQKKRGADVNYALHVDFADAALGTKRRLTLPDGRQLDVNIPPGTRDGAKLRLKGQGQPPAGDGVPGDAYVEIQVEPHRHFRREGDDLHLDLPITIQEAVLGAKVRVPTLDGSVTVTIPKGANQGAVLRLKGKGVPTGRGDERGDQYVKLVLYLPDRIDADLSAFMEKWGAKNPYDVRKRAGLAD